MGVSEWACTFVCVCMCARTHARVCVSVCVSEKVLGLTWVLGLDTFWDSSARMPRILSQNQPESEICMCQCVNVLMCEWFRPKMSFFIISESAKVRKWERGTGPGSSTVQLTIQILDQRHEKLVSRQAFGISFSNDLSLSPLICFSDQTILKNSKSQNAQNATWSLPCEDA